MRVTKNTVLIIITLIIPLLFYSFKKINQNKISKNEVKAKKFLGLKNSSNKPVKTQDPSQKTFSLITFSQLQNLTGDQISSLDFPSGKFQQKIEIDEDGSYIETLNAKNGQTITRIYSEGILSEETWFFGEERSFSKHWGSGRLLASSWKTGNSSITTFYDHSMKISKKIQTKNGETICYKYDENGFLLKHYKDECLNDDFREYIDQDE